MRLLPLLVLLCAAVLSVEGGPDWKSKCKYFGQICPKGKNCIPGYRKPALVCQSRKLLGGCAKLCRFGGSWCPDGKICRRTKAGRRCVWRKGTKVRSCKKLGQSCAKGRKCIPCYLRGGLCCRPASLLGKRKYCGVKYIVYGKKRCGGKSYKKGCRKVGKYCADGKYCRKYKGGYTCVFKKKLPRCRYFGQICGYKNRRNCVPCYYRKGLCCRRRSTLASGASHCRYGGKWCPRRQKCRQTIVKGVVNRRCVYVPPRCKKYGQTCGKGQVCLRCFKKLCCRKGVTKGQCQRQCKAFWKKCTLKGCGKGYNGWCCRPWRVTKAVCLKRCKGKWKYCTRKGCRKGYLGYCCKTKPYVSKKRCLSSCKGPWRYCTNKGCPKGFRGYCCKRRPYVTIKQCRRTCKGPWRYCTTKGCRKGFRGYCCKTRPSVTRKQCLSTCKGKWRYCSAKGCPKGFRGWCCKTRPYVTREKCKASCKGRYRYCVNKGCPKNFYGWCCVKKCKGKKVCRG